jgi:hypothetical protein
MGALSLIRRWQKRRPSAATPWFVVTLLVIVIVASVLAGMAIAFPGAGLTPRIARALGYSTVPAQPWRDWRLFGAMLLGAMVVVSIFAFVVHVAAGRVLHRSDLRAASRHHSE